MSFEEEIWIENGGKPRGWGAFIVGLVVFLIGLVVYLLLSFSNCEKKKCEHGKPVFVDHACWCLEEAK